MSRHRPQMGSVVKFKRVDGTVIDARVFGIHEIDGVDYLDLQVPNMGLRTRVPPSTASGDDHEPGTWFPEPYRTAAKLAGNGSS